MTEEPNGGLPPNLRRRLDELTPAEGATGDARHWSLSDIDQLLQDVRGAAPLPEFKPEPEPKPEPKPEIKPEPKPEPKPKPVGAAILPPESPLPPPPAPKPAPKPAPAPPKPKPEPKPEPPEPKTIPVPALTPAEVTEPAPEPEPMRFDLFQSQPVKPVGDTRPVRPEPIEKPGVLLRRVDMQMTSDLSPVPKVVPADELYVRRMPAAEEDIPEGQQRLENFDADAADSMDEAALQERLRRGKLERTTQFQTLRSLSERMEKDGETGALPPEPQEETAGPEYRAPGQRDSVFQLLQKWRSRRGSTALALGVFALLAVGLHLVGLFSRDFQTGPGYLTGMALFLAAGLVACGSDLLNGLKALLRRKPNADSLLLFAGLFCLAQQVLLFVSMNKMGESVLGETNPYRVAACAPLYLFLAAVSAAARWQQARQRCDNFRFCAYTAADGLYAVTALDARDVAKTPRQNALPGRAKTVLPVPVAFPAGFLRQSQKEDAADQSGKQLFPLSLGLAGLAALCAFLVQGTAVAVVSAAAAAASLCVPCASLLILTSLIRGLTRAPREVGVAILNTDAAQECSRAGAFVLDSADLYLPEKGRMHGWREFRQVRADEVLLYAAAIAIEAGGPLQAVFEGVVEGDYAVLPEVRDMTFEDRMGLSCWIHNQKVFFGNRSLLENHGVTVPLSVKDEAAYEHDGRRLIYLAVEKRLSAFFVVSYSPDLAMGPALRLLEHGDAKALVCNSDPCVAAETLCEAFELREGSLSLLRAAPSQACRKQMRTPRASLSAGVYHANSARAFLRALSACAYLQAGVKRLRLVQVVATITMFVLLLLFVLMRQLHVADSLIFIALEMIWAAVMHSATRG